MNKVILIAGKFNPGAVKLFQELCPQGFELDVFPDAEDRAKLEEKISRADYLFARGSLGVDAALLDHAGKLKMIQKWGVGYDRYDMELIGGRGIAFMNTAGGNAVQVAELTIGLLLAVYRRIVPAYLALQQGVSRKEELLPMCHVIDGKTIGVVGIGNIGRRVAAICRAFGAKVQYYDAYPLAKEAEEELGVTYSGLDELLATSDVVTLHVPLLPETKKMINRETLARMKPSAVLLNLGRDGLVDVDDLTDALQRGQIAGAGLDVLDLPGEAYATHPLMHMENVVVTPHIGGSTEEVLRNQVELCYKNVLGVDSGAYRDPRYFVNGKYLTHLAGEKL